MKRIALFGTSADPPTAGHQAIVVWLSQHYDWVAVWAADNPFKSHQTPLKHRAAMLRLLISEIASIADRDLDSRHGCTPHQFADRSVDLPSQNIGFHPELSSFRTLETVEKARELWGTNAEFTLVIGSDLVSQLPRWHRVEDLLRQVQVLVVPRPGYAIEEGSLERVRQLGGNIAIADLTGPAVSSTAYRENGEVEALTPPIEEYIHREHLYKCQDAPKKRLQIR